jgi:hypothetical protein
MKSQRFFASAKPKPEPDATSHQEEEEETNAEQSAAAERRHIAEPKKKVCLKFLTIN